MLNADIDVSGNGFRGGSVCLAGFGCNNTNYFLPLGQGGQKGEGIADYVTVSGATNGPFNGKFIIEHIPTSTTFVVKNSTTLATSFVSGLAERQHPKFVSFRPGTNDADTAWEPNNTDWTDPCYFEFSTSNISNTPITTMYGIFEVDTNIAEKRTLIYILNKQNNNVFEISINGYTITYAINDVTINTVDISPSPSEHFVVGFNIARLIASQGDTVGSFFSSLQSLQFFLGLVGQNIQIHLHQNHHHYQSPQHFFGLLMI